MTNLYGVFIGEREIKRTADPLYAAEIAEILCDGCGWKMPDDAAAALRGGAEVTYGETLTPLGEWGKITLRPISGEIDTLVVLPGENGPSFIFRSACDADLIEGAWDRVEFLSNADLVERAADIINQIRLRGE